MFIETAFYVGTSYLDLLSLCDDVAMTINMGSPFTGDGLRPVMPNVIRGKKFLVKKLKF